jgi:hypothetical protein
MPSAQLLNATQAAASVASHHPPHIGQKFFSIASAYCAVNTGTEGMDEALRRLAIAARNDASRSCGSTGSASSRLIGSPLESESACDHAFAEAPAAPPSQLAPAAVSAASSIPSASDATPPSQLAPATVSAASAVPFLSLPRPKPACSCYCLHGSCSCCAHPARSLALLVACTMLPQVVRGFMLLLRRAVLLE